MSQSMFERYGGFASISKVVLSFYERVLDSDQLAPFFDGVDMRHLVDHQTKFIATIMGGPTSYTDAALQQVHAHLNIDQATFSESVKLMGETLTEFEFEPDDIAAIVRGMREKERFIESSGSN